MAENLVSDNRIPMTVDDLLALPVVQADERIAYGEEPLQFGDLYLPDGVGPFPVVVMIHGGCWLAPYNLDHVSSFCAALAGAGYAVWSLEYRRVGDAGGGWPGTFVDVAHGTDFVRHLAQSFPLDLQRVAAGGHSAGGHLAMWLAARRQLSPHSSLYVPNLLPLKGVVALAGIPDLAQALMVGVCADAAAQLLGGSVDELSDRYRQASPAAWLPLGIPQQLVNGGLDEVVPADFVRPYAEMARKQGDEVGWHLVADAGHYELVTPYSVAWEVVKTAVFTVLTR